MVTIRLSRGGTKKRPFYQIVVTDSRNARDGRFIERIGFFNPVAAGHAKDISLNFQQIDYWIKRGAVASKRVLGLIKKARKQNDLK